MVNKTALIDYFIKQEQDGELIFQQFYYIIFTCPSNNLWELLHFVTESLW